MMAGGQGSPTERINLLNTAGHAPKLSSSATAQTAQGSTLSWNPATKAFDLVPGGGGGEGGAPANASYVVLGTNQSLTDERVLVGTTNRVVLIDNGAGGTLQLDIGASVYTQGGADVLVTDGGTGASNAPQARANLGLAIGIDVQGYDAQLAAIAATTPVSGSLHTWASDTVANVLPPGPEGSVLTLVGGTPVWRVLAVAPIVAVLGRGDIAVEGRGIVDVPGCTTVEVL